jgi:hypothetical protein
MTRRRACRDVTLGREERKAVNSEFEALREELILAEDVEATTEFLALGVRLFSSLSCRARSAGKLGITRSNKARASRVVFASVIKSF